MHPTHGRREGGGVGRGKNDAVVKVVEDVDRGAAGVGCDDGEACGRGLREDDAPRLVPAGEDETAVLGEKSGQVAGLHEASVGDVGLVLQEGGVAASHGFVTVIAAGLPPCEVPFGERETRGRPDRRDHQGAPLD